MSSILATQGRRPVAGSCASPSAQAPRPRGLVSNAEAVAMPALPQSQTPAVLHCPPCGPRQRGEEQDILYK